MSSLSPFASSFASLGLLTPSADGSTEASPLVLASLAAVCAAGGVYRLYIRKPHEWRDPNDQGPLSAEKKQQIEEASFTDEHKKFIMKLEREETQPKMVYNKNDFVDYVTTLAMTVGASWACYGGIKGNSLSSSPSSSSGFGLSLGADGSHIFTQIVTASALFLGTVFAFRHGTPTAWTWKTVVPVVVAQPITTVVNFVFYKAENLRAAALLQMALFFGEQAIFRSGIVEKIPVYIMVSNFVGGSASGSGYYVSALFDFSTLGLFYTSFAILTFFRTVSFLDHLRQSAHVFKFLSQTGWNKTLSFLPGASGKEGVYAWLDRVTGLTHAYVTGVWTHILTLVPLYVIFHAIRTSAGKDDPALQLLLMISWGLRFLLFELKLNLDWELTDFNDWYIRDHWLGHHSRFEFCCMHGPHHDALPLGMIAVADNGPLEGLVRHFAGHFDAYCCPWYAAFRWTKIIFRDMVGHQYVPGVLPLSYTVVEYGVHHVEHHYLSMHPLGNGIGCDPDPRNNCEVEKWLSGGKYDAGNKVWTWFVEQVREVEGLGKKED